MSSVQRHSSRVDIEAAAFGQLEPAKHAAVQAHAARCNRCSSLLARDLEVRQCLMQLTSDEPKVDVVAAVLQRLEHTSLGASNMADIASA